MSDSGNPTVGMLSDLVEAMDYPGDGWRDTISPEDAVWFDGLPKVLTNHRGCLAERIFGTSWTTDKAVAIDFARSYRDLDPVVATARIARRRVLFATNNRSEAEVLVYPQWIGHVSARPLLFVELALTRSQRRVASGVQNGVQRP